MSLTIEQIARRLDDASDYANSAYDKADDARRYADEAADDASDLVEAINSLRDEICDIEDRFLEGYDRAFGDIAELLEEDFDSGRHDEIKEYISLSLKYTEEGAQAILKVRRELEEQRRKVADLESKLADLEKPKPIPTRDSIIRAANDLNGSDM
jgi:chromosome segregation ATPase